MMGELLAAIKKGKDTTVKKGGKRGNCSEDR